MIEQYLREFYQKIAINPLADILKNFLTPNTVTLFSGLLGLLILPSLIFNHVIIAIMLLLLSGYCDTLDGTLARISKRQSAFGSILDIMMDRFVEFIVVFSLFIVDSHRAFLCLLMLGSMFLCVSSFLVVGIFTQNETHKSFYYSPGIIERAEAFLFFIAMMVFKNDFNFLAILFTILVMLTTFIRLYQFNQQCQGSMVRNI